MEDHYQNSIFYRQITKHSNQSSLPIMSEKLCFQTKIDYKVFAHSEIQ